MTHTPGPWNLEKDGCWFNIIADSGDDIVGDSGILATSEEDKANALLIAAAPDMLEALKYARRFVVMSLGSTDVPLVDAAIAKAEGR